MSVGLRDHILLAHFTSFSVDFNYFSLKCELVHHCAASCQGVTKIDRLLDTEY